ncbi:MAG: DUF2726 domain-containing protein [Blautia sp.]|nr:DUF2726 domain-containing protein [Lachnoclostridium sp.]MCM1210938.1 DUF2726 domain-containing protein [Blautia sp.]
MVNDAKIPEDNRLPETEEIIKRRLWDSDAEQIVFECLQRFIDFEKFYIVPHILVSEVIKNFRKYEQFENMYNKYCELVNKPGFSNRHFELMHFDFVVYSKADYFPVLIVEADGQNHKTKQNVMYFDKFKNYIAEQYDIPLVRLELYHADIDIEAELKKRLENENLKDAFNYPIYCWRCGRKLRYQKNKDFYYCDSCQRKTGKNVTVSNTEKICPPLFVWDK